MTNNLQLQTVLKGKLKEDFERYQKRENLNNSEAARELLSFALRILLQETDNTKPTNREIMEEIYRYMRYNSAITNMTFAHAFNEQNKVNSREPSTESRKQLKAWAFEQADEFINGEQKNQ